MYVRSTPINVGYRLKKNQDTAPSCDRGLAEELPAPTAIQKKKMLVVAKRKVSAVSPEKLAIVGTPRRSPRIVANTHVNITDRESTSPEKARSAKRAHAVDKTYAPDVADDGALDDDAGEFGDAADKIKRRKRQIDGDVPSCSVLKNTHGGKKPRAMNKPQGRNKKSDAANVHPKRKFQQTVRCSLREVLEAVKLLKDRHIVKVRLAGFGCVFDWVLEGNVTRILMCYLLMKIDTSTMKIQCGSGRVLEVNREAVHQVFGFPMGGDTAPRPADSGHDESMSILKRELGFERNASIETKDLRSLLASLVNDPEKDDLAVKVFFAILYNKLICPGSAVRLGREAAMLVNMDYERMSKMDFCQLVVDEIKRAAEKYQDRTINHGLEGCGVVPVVMYLDSCNSPKYSVMHTKTPRVNYLHEKPLRDIFYMDMMFNGGSDILNYKFGNVTWKGCNEIAYSYRLPEEEIRLEPSLSSPTRSSSLNSDPVPLAVCQHELVLSQDEAAIYDVTPMLRPDGAAAVIVDSLGCTGGPLFDSTPLQLGTYDGNNVTEPMSAAFDATPFWQDTPSQSVDGTEEVTQEHDVQSQLEKYAEEYGARVAVHQEELKAFYGRNPSRLKKHQDTAPSCDCGIAEELRAPTVIQKRKRLAVAKRKVSAVSPKKLPTVGTPWCSPGVVANTHMNITDRESMSPEISRSAKRARAVDKTNAPDVADDGALDDEAGEFEDAAEKIKRRKRQIDGDVPSCSVLKNTHGGKKPRAMNKPQGRNKKSDAAKVHPKRKFQQTVRCSLREVLEAVKLLKDRHIVKVRLAGFGCVFDWVLEGNVTRILMCYLLMKIDTSTMKIQCGSGRVLEVNREAVHQVFGFPMGGDTAPRPADSGHDESLSILKRELGFERNASIETKDLRSLLASLVNDPEKDDLAVKVFFAILYNKLICPGSTVRVGREAAMLVNMDYDKMSKMDFCQLVVDEIKRAAEKYQDRTINQPGLEGCGVVPVVMYLDSCNSPKYSVMHTKTPRANYLHEKPLRDIFYMDMMFNGGCDILNYKFGNVTWKGRNDIAYSYRLPEEELRLEPILSRPTQSSSLKSDPVPEAELVAALKLASKNLDKAIEAREQVMKVGDAARNMFEELKKMVANNFDLTKKVGGLQMEVELARKDALLLWKGDLITEKECLDKQIEMAKRGEFLGHPGPSDS